jgi:hypothetical protein
MPTTPEQVVTTLREALEVKASVVLEYVDDAPHAVVTGPSGLQTWVDLRASLAAYQGEDAPYIAAAIMAFERWDALDLDQLLGELCVKLGFCDAAYQKDSLRSRGPFTADAFADAVIEAEGHDPETSQWRSQVREIAAKHFGSGPD